MLAGSLDRAVDVAATLELRGYGLDGAAGRRGPRAAVAPRRAASTRPAAVVLAAAIVAKALGADGFDAYPTVEIGAGPATVVLAAVLLAAVVRPVAAHASPPAGAREAVACLTSRHRARRPALSTSRGSPTPIPAPTARRCSDVSLRLGAGEFAVLAGRSGCGKSTLLRAACGLVPHFHGGEIEGSVRVGGIDALAAGPGELAAAVGYVAQDPETQVVSTTVAAEIELPLEMRGERPRRRARAVEEVALALAIPHLLDRTVDTLSGGELQRVALAAALVTRPGLVLLDEPTSQLDPVAGDELIWLLRRLNEEWGVAILLAEHRLERCLAAADRVIAMDAGAVSFDGSAARLPRLGAGRRPGPGDARRPPLLARRASSRCRSGSATPGRSSTPRTTRSQRAGGPSSGPASRPFALLRAVRPTARRHPARPAARAAEGTLPPRHPPGLGGAGSVGRAGRRR